MAQALADMIWRRWRKEYLPTQAIRSKWNKEQKNLKRVIISFLKNGDTPQSHANATVDTFPCDETRNGTLMRPAAKLRLLEESL